MSVTGQRHAFLTHYRAAATRDGKLLALDADVHCNGGFSLDLSGAVCDRALFHSDGPYKWPNVCVRGHVCRTNQPSHTAFRGFGGPQGLLVSESAIEHLAVALGMSPTTMRERNLYAEGDRTHFGQPIIGWNVPRCLSELKARCDFDGRSASIEEFNRVNRYKKRGISIMPTKYGINFTAKFMNQGGALVHLYGDGTVLVSHGGTEMGQGLHTKMIQVAAQAFGIPEEKVFIADTSTDKVANTSPTAASMSTDLYGMATLNACEQILERLRPFRAKLPPTASFVEVVQAALFDRIDLSAHGYYAVPNDRCGYDWAMQTTDNSARGNPFNYFTQGVACSEVEVDCLTGDMRVLRTDILMDVG